MKPQNSSYIIGQGKPREECGIFGIFGSPRAANLSYLGLYALQHRGQESAGIASSDGYHIYRYAGMGKVVDIFQEEHIKNLALKKNREEIMSILQLIPCSLLALV